MSILYGPLVSPLKLWNSLVLSHCRDVYGSTYSVVENNVGVELRTWTRAAFPLTRPSFGAFGRNNSATMILRTPFLFQSRAVLRNFFERTRSLKHLTFTWPYSELRLLSSDCDIPQLYTTKNHDAQVIGKMYDLSRLNTRRIYIVGWHLDTGSRTATTTCAIAGQVGPTLQPV